MLYFFGYLWLFCGFIVYFFPYAYFSEIAISFLPYLAPFSLLLAVFFLIRLFFVEHKGFRRLFSWILILGLCYLGFVGVFRVSSFYSAEYEGYSSGSDTLSLLYANVYVENFYYTGMIESIEIYDPDIVVFVEYADHHYSSMKSYLEGKYEFINRRSWDVGYDGTLIAAGEQFRVEPIKLVGSIDLERYVSDVLGLDISVVHTSAPISYWHYQLRGRQFEYLVQHMKDLITDNQENRGTLVLGDFNLSPWSAHRSDFVGAIGNGWNVVSRYLRLGMTWQAPVLSFFQSHIDHIVANHDIQVHNVEIFDLDGSDHDGYVFTFTVAGN